MTGMTTGAFQQRVEAPLTLLRGKFQHCTQTTRARANKQPDEHRSCATARRPDVVGCPSLGGCDDQTLHPIESRHGVIQIDRRQV